VIVGRASLVAEYVPATNVSGTMRWDRGDTSEQMLLF
jgi:hypothetical protein